MLDKEAAIGEIVKLDGNFHRQGILGKPAIQAIAHYASQMEINYTAETGSGQSTLLFSNISPSHKVFAIDSFIIGEGNSVEAAKDSTLCRMDTVEFILGPTQLTLPQYEFKTHFDMVLLDGPHGYPFPDLEYYYFYPHLREGSLLIVDDIQIPSIANMFTILAEDDMFEVENIIEKTGFLRRTSADLFPVDGDHHWKQNYNSKERKDKFYQMLRKYQHAPGQSPFTPFLWEPDGE